MEHKQFMLMRIKYLYSVGVLKDSDFVEKAQRVYKKATVVHNLGIKIMLHPNDDSVNRLCDLILELNEMEKQYLPEVLSQIQEAEVNDNV